MQQCCSEGVWGERLDFCQTGAPALPGGNSGDTARRVKLTLSICSLCRTVPSSARGSHGLQRGKVLGAKSRFSTTAAHPSPLRTLPCFPPLQPCIPTVSPTHLSPYPGVWLGVPGTRGCTLNFSAPCPVSAPSTPRRSRHCSLGSAPSLPPTATSQKGLIRTGSHTAFTQTQLYPFPFHLTHTPCPP